MSAHLHPFLPFAGAVSVLLAAPEFARGFQGSDPANVAQCAKLVSGAVQQAGYFGHDVALSGSTVLVGALGEYGFTGLEGAGYVFVLADGGTPNDYSDDAWVLQATLPDPSQMPYPLLYGDQFGVSVGIDGDTAVVGAYGDDNVNGIDAGAAYVYQRVGTIWSELAVLTARAGAANDWFGRAVAISGDTIVVGAPLDDVGPAVDAGSVYVFVRNDNGTPTIPTDDFFQQTQQFSGSAGDQFGFDVAIDGSVLVVGARWDDETYVDQGSVTVFTRNGAGTWTASSPKLVHPNAAPGDEFGVAVAVHGDRVVVGAYIDDSPLFDAGSAHVFERFGSSWAHQQVLVPLDAAVSNGFGRSVTVDNQRIVVGSPWSDYAGSPDLGSIYVFELSGSSWTQKEKVDACDGTGPYDQLFGHSVASDNGLLVSGTHAYHVLSSDDAGAAYVYRLTTATQFSSFCYGDGSGTQCPCMNNSTVGRRQGCQNSNPAGVLGARLTPLGTPSAGADDLHMAACNLIPSALALLFCGPGQHAGVPIYDGLRCVGGPNIKRLGGRIPDSAGNALWGPGLRVRGGWNSGQTRYFQVWYRNTLGGPCGTGSNMSSGAGVTFTP